MRGIRGAITVESDDEESIWQAGETLISEIMQRNQLRPEDIGAIIFSMTDDLQAAFPTTGVRRLSGFEFVPLFDARQCAIDGSLPKCIRALVLADTAIPQREIRHVYLKGAAKLRPDLAASDD